jgi:cysteinyl-tRNA synthetase
MKIYNTLSRAKEELIPIKGGIVNMFVCGPTVYDYSHLGHAKTYTQFDFIAKYFRKNGLKVFYLQNITDIDDKIIKRAGELGVTPKELAAKFEAAHLSDMQALKNTAVDEFARATDYIPMIVNQAKELIRKGFAYKTTDGYYFDLKKFPDYGKLSGRTYLQEQDSVSRIDENPEKRNKGDFCLWKFRKEAEPYWDTELGKGRPGWHIEDTAITEAFFGSQYDLHGGAVDLIFPHHEAEIAQQEAASGKKPFVKYWMHTAFLNVKNDKMAKSKGNFLTIKDALRKHTPSALRLFFISNHYRTQLDFSPDVLEHASRTLERLKEFIRRIDKALDDESLEGHILTFKSRFYSRLDDDFDTPGAFAELFDFVREINARGGAGKKTLELMHELNILFDFLTLEEETLPKEVEELVAKREEARARKDFAASDKR